MGTVSLYAVPPQCKDHFPAQIFSIVVSVAITSSANNLSTESARRLAAITLAQQSQYSRFANTDATRRETAVGPRAALHGRGAGLLICKRSRIERRMCSENKPHRAARRRERAGSEPSALVVRLEDDLRHVERAQGPSAWTAVRQRLLPRLRLNSGELVRDVMVQMLIKRFGEV